MTRSLTTTQESSIFSTPKWPSSRRTHSFSSSSSSDSLPASPATPLYRNTGRIPFSWESIPGKPKNDHIITGMPLPGKPKNVQIITGMPLAGNHLPLPPPVRSGRRGHNYENATRRGNYEKDPFFAALVECSKNGGDEVEDDVAGEVNKDVFGGMWKLSGGRSLLMGSCKSASDIAESLVLNKTRTRARRIGYELVKK